MERYTKKSKILDTLAKYSHYEIIPEAIAFVILSEAEVQDALTFTASVSGDLRYRSLIQVIRKDEIWKHWFERDLEIVLMKYGRDIARFWDNIELKEGPAWKVYYLWWRLIISAYQWEFLQQTRRILRAYPPESRISYIRLNEFQLITAEGEILYLDFRKEFVRMTTTFQAFRPQYAKEVEYAANWLWLLQGYQRTRFFHVKFPNIFGNFARSLELTYEAMIALFSDQDQERIFQLKGLVQDTSIFERPPRIVEQTTLIVSSCITCGAQAQFKENMNRDNTFCAKACQRKFYSE